MSKTFMEMYMDGWCQGCKKLEEGICAERNICLAYEENNIEEQEVNDDGEQKDTL